MVKQFPGNFFNRWFMAAPWQSSMIRCTLEYSSMTSNRRMILGDLKTASVLISLCTISSFPWSKQFLSYVLSAKTAFVCLWTTLLIFPKAPLPISKPISNSPNLNAYSSILTLRLLCNNFLNSLTLFSSCSASTIYYLKFNF